MTIDVDKYRKIVNSHGRFQKQSPATPYFWELALSGEGDLIVKDDIAGGSPLSNPDNPIYEGPEATLFEPAAEEKEAFGLEKDFFMVWRDFLGSVFGREYDTREAADAYFQKYC